MKYMRRRGLRMFAVAALLPMLALAQTKESKPTASPEDQATVRHVTQMVQEFLAAVPKGEKQTFDNFFADDVIYTRAVGVTVTKADILKNIDVRAVNEPTATFSADDFTVHPYGNMAVVNFRLIMSTQDSGKNQATYFRNTGTFLKRNGKWQVVAWQATKVPPVEAKP
ncbi:MAG TPA: nuclear transport factor 2 family protein [Candidatus Angelobacter sp.]|nr:nuclear transport factor 2 family protein [Candidatus Angelobacter sp.]